MTWFLSSGNLCIEYKDVKTQQTATESWDHIIYDYICADWKDLIVKDKNTSAHIYKEHSFNMLFACDDSVLWFRLILNAIRRTLEHFWIYLNWADTLGR